MSSLLDEIVAVRKVMKVNSASPSLHILIMPLRSMGKVDSEDDADLISDVFKECFCIVQILQHVGRVLHFSMELARAVSDVVLDHA